MRRLFIFSVGGTGARVMRSLTMLMAAGELADYEVVPILIDFDIANGNLDQTHWLMWAYKAIHEKSYGIGDGMHNEGFFCSPLRPIMSFNQNNTIGNKSFILEMPTFHHDMQVRDLLGYPNLMGNEYAFRLLLDSLFTTDNNSELNQNLCVGFKGNAKIARLGYAALKIQDTIEFMTFLNNIVPNRDKVIVVGSTFGGTGSAGVIEILRQLLRYGHHEPINNIATVLIEPYFLPIPDPAIGAVDYYSVFKRRSKEFYKFYRDSGLADFVNTTYKIGMDGFVIYENAFGGQMQMNIAHPVELLSAMAICEYAQTEQQGTFDYCLGQQNLQFGNDRIEEFDFYYLPNGRRVFELLTRFILSAKMYKELFRGHTHVTDLYFYRVLQQRNMIDRYYKDTLYRMFAESFHWIEELSYSHNNKYWLSLFDVNAPMDEILIGHAYSHNRGAFFSRLLRRNIVYDYIDNMNAYYHTHRNESWFNNLSSEQTLVRLLSESSLNIFQQFINQSTL